MGVNLILTQMLPLCAATIGSSTATSNQGYVEHTIALATHAVQHAVDSPTPWFPVVATLCTGNGSLPGGCNAENLPVARDLEDLTFVQLVLGNTTGAARPTVIAQWDAGGAMGQLRNWREETQNDWVGDRMVPLPCEGPRLEYVAADAALANIRKQTTFSDFVSVDLRFPLDPCVSEPVFTCECCAGRQSFRCAPIARSSFVSI